MLAGVVALSACDQERYEPNPRDVEDPAIPAVSSGACGTTPVVDLLEVVWGPDRPPSGTLVAVEGVPVDPQICTASVGEGAACDDGCERDPACFYALFNQGPEPAEICLAHPDFVCGGSDCSPFCAPFSREPLRRYRFVGTIRFDLTPTLDVTSYCRVDT